MGTGLSEEVTIKTGHRFPLAEAWPAATIDTHNPAAWVGSLDAQDLAIQLDRIGPHFSLDDFPGEGHPQPIQPTQQARREDASATVTASRPWPREVTRFKDQHFQPQSSLARQVKQMEGGKTTGWSAANDTDSISI
jgi:hypothetical protein